MKQHHSRPVAALALVLAAAAPCVAEAQAGAPLPGMMPGGVLPTELGRCCDGFRVGLWVEYAVHRRDRRGVVHLHLAVVGRESAGWWIEMTVADSRAGEVVARLLVAEGETDRVGGRLLRLVVQPEGQIPLELPLTAARSTLPDLDAGEGPGVLVGTEQLRLDAGTFASRRYRRGEGPNAREVWISERVPLWGLARYVGPSVRMSLVAMGTGAASRVVGEPVPFDPATFR